MERDSCDREFCNQSFLRTSFLVHIMCAHAHTCRLVKTAALRIYEEFSGARRLLSGSVLFPFVRYLSRAICYLRKQVLISQLSLCCMIRMNVYDVMLGVV